MGELAVIPFCTYTEQKLVADILFSSGIVRFFGQLVGRFRPCFFSGLAAALGGAF